MADTPIATAPRICATRARGGRSGCTVGNLTRMARGESRRLLRWGAIALISLPAPLGAQARSATPPAPAPRLDLGAATLANGEEVQYLRALSALDSARDYSPLIQPFSAAGDTRWRGMAQRAAQPWAARYEPRQRFAPQRLASLDWQLLRPDARLWYSSALPTQQAEGVAWAGRGATVALQAGVAAQWRGVRVQLAPVAFHAQNQAFTIALNGQTGPLAYGDARFPRNIDYPQRFGDDAYARVDWGDSFIDVTGFGISAGFSNARQHWGPARVYPIVLGGGSGGFAHGFVGTAAPRDVKLGRVQLRLMAGRLEQTEYSVVQTGETARSLAGVIGSFSPAFLPGLEVGAIRIANAPWPDGGLGWREITRPFVGVINDNESSINQNRENQFASLFFRLAPPRSGFEVYAELSREDFAGNARALAEIPDDLMDYVLGLSQTRRSADGTMHVLRFELANGERSHIERISGRPSGPFPPYRHAGTLQGLTNRGQLLGSPAVYGGGGGTVAWDRYDARGRVSLVGERTMILDWLPGIGEDGLPWSEIRYGARAELLRFRGDGEWAVGVAPSYTLNRNLEQGRDVFDIAVTLRWTGW